MTDALCLGRPILAIVADKSQGYNEQRDKTEQAGLGTDHAAGEPARSAKGGTEDTVIGQHGAVRNSVESLSPVPCRWYQSG